MRSKLLTLSLIALLSVALVTGVGLYSPENRERQRPTGDVITDLDGFRVGLAMRVFDAASGVLVDSYQARDVSAADWVQSADHRIPIMGTALTFVAARIAVAKGRQRSDFKRYLRLSRDQLTALLALRVALRESDVQNEIHAWNRLRRPTDGKTRIYEKNLQRQGVNVDFFLLLPHRVHPKSPTN